MKTFLLCGVLGASLIACDDAGDPGVAPQPAPEITGGLNRTTFTYGCTAPGDPQCDADADLAPTRTESPFPRIAVGGSFALTAKAATDYDNLTVSTVDTDFLAYDTAANTFTAKQAGIVSVTADASDVPVDFANVELVVPTRLKLLQATPQGDFKGASLDFSGKGISYTEDTQYTFKFRAVLVDENDVILAGALPCTWTSSNDAVGHITSEPNDNIVTVVSGSAGTSTVSVDYGTFHGTIDLEVGQ